MMKFEIGDRVKCVDDAPHSNATIANLVLGKIYFITDISSQSNCLKVDNMFGFWSPYRFIHVDASEEEAVETIDYLSITKNIVGG